MRPVNKRPSPWSCGTYTHTHTHTLTLLHYLTTLIHWGSVVYLSRQRRREKRTLGKLCSHVMYASVLGEQYRERNTEYYHSHSFPRLPAVHVKMSLLNWSSSAAFGSGLSARVYGNIETVWGDCIWVFAWYLGLLRTHVFHREKALKNNNSFAWGHFHKATLSETHHHPKNTCLCMHRHA